MNPIEKVIKHFGEITEIQKITGVTYPAVVKWRAKGRFPRTDYTGETNHAEKLSKASKGALTVEELLPKYKKTKTPSGN